MMAFQKLVTLAMSMVLASQGAMAAPQYLPFHLLLESSTTPFHLLPTTPFQLLRPPTTPFQPLRPPTTSSHLPVEPREEGHAPPFGSQNLSDNLISIDYLAGKARNAIVPRDLIVKAIKGAGDVAPRQEDTDSPTPDHSAHPDPGPVDAALTGSINVGLDNLLAGDAIAATLAAGGTVSIGA